MYADISFAPMGEKSHQGVLGFYGGALVQWESSRQPFATLSTAEAELVGYIEAMIMGDSLCAVLDIMEGGHNGGGITEKVIYGDNTAALAIVQNPDGPWRTRHLRLRANVLRERVRGGEWQVRHLPGCDLVADYLTKTVASMSQWLRFYAMTGMLLATSEVDGMVKQEVIGSQKGLTKDTVMKGGGSEWAHGDCGLLEAAGPSVSHREGALSGGSWCWVRFRV